MIKVAIVEDDNNYAAVLNDYIIRFGKEKNRAVSCVRFGNAVHIVENYRSENGIILMDIDLPMINGMEAARLIREKDKSVVIIFITNLAQYACEGYGVEALDFIVKPISYAEFVMKFARAVSRMDALKEREFSIPIAGGVYRLFPDKIMYVEVISHKILYHTTENIIESREALSSVESRLKESRFLRLSKSYLINPRHIVSVEGLKVTVTNGEEIYLSHGRRRDFLRELASWKSGR